MTKNPFYNAILAVGYIALVATVMFSGVGDGPDTVLSFIAFISLFTLSAAVMGYLFLFQPLRMYFEGEKLAAVKFFLHTLLAFAGLTAALLLVLSFL